MARTRTTTTRPGSRSWRDVLAEELRDPAVAASYSSAKRAYEVGQEIRRLRVSRRVSQTELARRMGTTQSAVARLEVGGVLPTITTLERAARALGATLDVHLVAP